VADDRTRAIIHLVWSTWSGSAISCSCPAAKRDELLAASKTHFEAFEAHKKVCWRARALSRAQRALLYALDELEMSTMRLHLRAPGERVKPEEALYKLHPAEVPVKNAVRE
jgi:hypothetical protein